MTDYPGPGGPDAGRAANPPAEGPYQQGGYQIPQAPPMAPGYGYGQYPQQAVPAGMYYHQASGLLLPNGTELASVGRRIGAYFLGAGLAIVTLVIGYVIWGLILWPKGQSPALKVLGMQVWKPEQQRPATFGTMALRDILGRIAEGLMITSIISFVLMCATGNRKTLHDMIAGTVVLRDPNRVVQPR